MRPRGDSHTHLDPVCGLAWPCVNKSCVEPTERWCARALVCMGEPGLHQVTRLTEIAEALHVAEQDYRVTFHNTTLANRCAELREQLLTLVDDANHEYLARRGR